MLAPLQPPPLATTTTASLSQAVPLLISEDTLPPRMALTLSSKHSYPSITCKQSFCALPYLLCPLKLLAFVDALSNR
jgi:hypothetical protein